MGVPKRLTEMQKRFAEYLVFNEGRTTGADAANKNAIMALLI